MGISYVMVDWLARLSARGVFKDKQSILDLGPQDLHKLTAADIAHFIDRVTGCAPSPSDIEDRFFDNGRPRRWTAARDFYAVLGLTDYHASDLEDPRADYAVDLNRPSMLSRKFDVITDFGTLEHVFNIGNAVKFIHDHLDVGGLALHVLPTRGDYNHGFYNIHSTFYKDLCAANGYELVNFSYVPDFGRQNLDRDPNGRPLILDANTIDHARHDQAFAQAVINCNPASPRTYDYLFTAYRKTSDAEFAYPMQVIYPDTQRYRDLAEAEFYRIARRFDACSGAAQGYLDGQRWAEANALIVEALVLASENESIPHARQRLSGIYAAAAQTHMTAERWAAAETALRAALALVPDETNALYALAVACAKADRPAEAIAAIARVCELLPDDLEAFGFLAQLRAEAPRNGDGGPTI